MFVVAVAVVERWLEDAAAAGAPDAADSCPSRKTLRCSLCHSFLD